jgi:putative addiction module component (TIGR02574 family)
MARTALDLLNEALKLPAAERAEVASGLLDSLDDTRDDAGDAASDVDRAWGEEIARRVAEIDGGTVQPMSWEDAQRVIDRDDPET